MVYKKYNQIANFFNRILKENANSPEIISISWLYLKRLHPNDMKLYLPLYSSKVIFFKHVLLEFSINHIKIFINFIKCLVQNKLLGKIPSQDIVIISHYIHQHNYNNGDFYYKLLEQDLRKKKLIKKIFLLKDQNNIKFQISKKDRYDLIPNFINPIVFFKIYLKQIRLSCYFFKKAFEEKKKFNKRVYGMLLCKTINPGTIYNLIKYEQLKFIFKNSNSIATICNFEGNAIERIIFLASSINNKKSLKIGYSHTTNFPLRNSVYLKLNQNLMPDSLILNSYQILDEFKKKGFKNLFLLGLLSNINKKISIDKSKKKNILIIPEGIKDEFDRLYQFSLKLADLYPNYKFILRPHPVQKINYKSTINNLIISSKTLDHDLSVSKYVLFRGTTLIIHCIKNKIIPIYVDFGEGYNCNIFDNSLREFIYEINQNNINSLNFDIMSLNKKIYFFSKNYFSSYSKAKSISLINFLYIKK